jgi:hypothetical protein
LVQQPGGACKAASVFLVYLAFNVASIAFLQFARIASLLFSAFSPHFGPNPDLLN